MKKFIKNFPPGVASILITLVVAWLSLSPHPLGGANFILFKNADKLVHFLMYFGLASVYYLDYAKSRLPHHTHLEGELTIIFTAIVLSGFMEIAQELTGVRTMDLWDFIANSAGCITAFAFIKLYFMHVFRRYLLKGSRNRPSSSHHHSRNEGEDK